MMEYSGFEPTENSRELLLKQEEDLKTRFLQRATFIFRAAENLEESHSTNYFQGVEAETPVSTIAIRLDAKTASPATGKAKKVFIFAPREDAEDLGKFFDCVWIKRVDEGGVEAMYQLDEHGFSVYQSEYDINLELNEPVELADTQEEQIETTIKDFAMEALKQQRISVRNLRALVNDVLHDYKIVPFDS